MKSADFQSLAICVLTVSDSRTLAEDTSGDFLVQALTEAGHRIAERALLDAAADFARAEGAAGLMLETMADNAPARALYRAAGWHEDATQWYSLDVR